VSAFVELIIIIEHPMSYSQDSSISGIAGQINLYLYTTKTDTDRETDRKKERQRETQKNRGWQLTL